MTEDATRARQVAEITLVNEYEHIRKQAEKLGLSVEASHIEYFTIINGKDRIPIYSVTDLGSFVHGYATCLDSSKQ